MQQERFPLYLLYPASIETDTSYHCKRCVYKEKILGHDLTHKEERTACTSPSHISLAVTHHEFHLF